MIKINIQTVLSVILAKLILNHYGKERIAQGKNECDFNLRFRVIMLHSARAVLLLAEKHHFW